MQYLGGKFHGRKHICPLLNRFAENTTAYIEPFVGAGHILTGVMHPSRYAYDIHPYLISMWIAIQRGWIPPHDVSCDEYYQIRDNKDNFTPELVGFVGFACSFGGKWFGGYAINSRGSNYSTSGRNSLLRVRASIQNVVFGCSNYADIAIPNGSLVYCDPPYQDTTQYSYSFDSNMFWEWVRYISIKNVCIVSEFSAPVDFVEIYRYEKNRDIKRIDDGSKREKFVDKLFVYDNGFVDPGFASEKQLSLF